MLPFLYLLLVVSLNDPEKLQKHGLDGIFAVTWNEAHQLMQRIVLFVPNGSVFPFLWQEKKQERVNIKVAY